MALYRLAGQYRKTLEILPFQGNTKKTVFHGKGYGEMECINYALDNSQLLKSSDTFVKLTGRVIVLNFDCVLHSAIKPNTFYAMTSGRFPYIETIIYRTEKDFFQKHLSDAGNLVFDREEIYLEHVFYQRLHELASQCPIGSFKAYRFLKGFSGSSGYSYETKWVDKFKLSSYAFFKKFDINRL